jgi:hypothetical protein
MRNTASYFLVPLLLLLVAGCAKKDNSVAPDIEAPVITVLLPVADDTVGIATVGVVLNVTDDIEVQSVRFLIDGVPADTVYAAPFQSSLDISLLPYGPHTLLVRAFDATGKSSEKSVSFVKGIKSVEAVVRYTLCEIVTSANCVPCVGADSIYHEGTNNAFYKERVITVKYHAYFPPPPDNLWLASQTICRPRLEYLFVPPGMQSASSPNGWVSGTKAGSSAPNWLQLISDDLKAPPEAKFELSKKDSAGKTYVTIKVTGLASSSFNDLRLHTVVTETDIMYKGTNGVPIHYDVMRTMLPGPEGESLSLADGQTKVFTREITLDPSWAPGNCSVVVFVQSNGSKHVLQAGRIALR